MRRIFWGFCRNWFLTDTLHYLSSRSDFGFEFAEIFVVEKRLPGWASQRLSDSTSLGVDDSPTWRVIDSPTWGVADSPTRRVVDSPSRRVGFWMFKRKSQSRRLAESAFECLKENRRVVDSLTRRVGESLWWVRESLFEIFLNFSSIYRTLNG